jgi:hypothetical protein
MSKQPLKKKGDKKITSSYRKQDTFYCIVNERDGMILDSARLPIFYLKKVAKEVADGFKGSTIVKIQIINQS